MKVRNLAKSQKDFEDFKNNYKLAKNSFELPGLGDSKDWCMSLRLNAFAKNNEVVKYGRYKCRRVECPRCWTDWARRRVFKIAMRLLAFRDWESPNDFVKRLACDSKFLIAKELYGCSDIYSAVCSVPPSKAKTWNWNRLNESLFRRGYRRMSDIGVVGGYALFHPFRIVKRFKNELRNEGWGTGELDAGYWKGIRNNALDLSSWSDYVKFSPHLHTLVLGSPEKHDCSDFVIRFKSSSGSPNPLSVDEVIGYLFYIITHVGVCREFKSRPTRSFGVLYNIEPSDFLTDSEYNSLASRLADKIGMVWNSGDNELNYKSNESSEYDWVPVWKLDDYLTLNEYEDWRDSISDRYKEFLDIVWSRTWVLRHPPPLENMIEDHDFYSIGIVCEILPEDNIEDLSNDLLR